MEIKEQIVQGKCCLGIELGSTRIKAVLIGTCLLYTSDAADD